MRARRHSLAAVLSVVLQLAVSFGLTADLVLCSNGAGHVAVESAFSAECCDAHVLPEGLRGFQGPDDCGCVDTPLLQSAVGLRSKLEHSLPSPETVLLPAFALPDVARTLCRPASAPHHRSWAPEEALAARRSVVLLV